MSEHHDIRAYGGVKLSIYISKISKLHRGEWPASGVSLCTLGKEMPISNLTGRFLHNPMKIFLPLQRI